MRQGRRAFPRAGRIVAFPAPLISGYGGRVVRFCGIPDHEFLSARQRLRGGTRDIHEAVEAAFARFDLSAVAGYRAFLSAQAGAFLPMEAAADRAGAGDLIPDWAARRRGDLLTRDLDDLQATERGAALPVELSGAPAVLGVVYVLEGSRLGGKLLRRRLPIGAPSRFLGGPDDGARWPAFVRLLDERLVGPGDVDAALASARGAFDRFLIAARGGPE